MIPTLFGLIITLVGATLFFRASIPAMLVLVLVASLMSGSAAFQLPALGGSSIPPAHYALGFLALRIVSPGSRQAEAIGAAVHQNRMLIAFVGYGVVMAIFGPRLFAGAIDVVPMRIVSTGIYQTVPLSPSSQNMTTAIYLMGTMVAGICSFVVMRNAGGSDVLVRTGVVVAWIHIFLGVAGVALKGTVWSDILNIFRNGSYAQLDQQIGDVVRMNGIMPEPSTFAGFGLVWFIFLFECWFRGVRPRRTGPAALAMALTLAASTSSTAYVGLAGYAAIVAIRSVLFPRHLPAGRLVMVALIALVLFVVASAALLLAPSTADTLWDVLLESTVRKQDSKSGLQRAFWATQGLRAFAQSYGLGIGPGSFRSSSLITAIIGSMGIAGFFFFAAHLLHVLKPWRATTYHEPVDERTATGVAASWTALGLLVPAAVSGAGADPGNEFALFAGAALALRARERATGDGDASRSLRARSGADVFGKPMKGILIHEPGGSDCDGRTRGRPA